MGTITIMFVAPGGRVQGVVDALFERAYGIWPSHGPAVVLASLVISVSPLPGAVVLYLLTVLLVTACVIRPMALSPRSPRG